MFSNSCIIIVLGKCIPVIRGGGVYQVNGKTIIMLKSILLISKFFIFRLKQAVDLCIEKLANGDWVHIFPEGKVNMTKENLRFKWGVGRMIYESPVMPIIVPIWHEGMDHVLPNYPPYFLKFGKKITINVGQPINISDLVNSLKSKNTPEPVARKIITDRLQEEMGVSFRHFFHCQKEYIPNRFSPLFQMLRQSTEKLHAMC